ncbi:MAG: hypothetical protein K2K01_08455 [Eubacterium sp.]|nr:hypothetical protein [Eubacterium sp.]
MKGHLKRIGTFLGYTLVFNIVSFILYFTLAFSSHYFEGLNWLVLGPAQICFTILFFNKAPLPKFSNENGYKIDLVIYFIILCLFSFVAAFYREDSWLSFSFFNTYYTFPLSLRFFDSLGFFAGVYIIENAIKTFLLSTNISKKRLPKPICIILCVIMALSIITMICLLLALE